MTVDVLVGWMDGWMAVLVVSGVPGHCDLLLIMVR